MLPNHTLSTSLIYGNYLYPDYLYTDGLVDYELGGIGLSNATSGLMVQVWTATLAGIPGEAGTAVYVSAPNTPSTLLFQRDGITEISLAFDQNMKPFIAFVAAGQATFWWYDATLPGQKFTDLPVGSSSPKCTLDDKRSLQTLVGTSDILITYIKDDNLYYREQRDRYTVEYLLKADLSALLLAPKVGKLAMTNKERVQFYLYGSLLPP